MTRHVLLALAALALAACGQQTATTETAETTAPETTMPAAPAMSDAEFVQAVANADAFEIQSSQLAAQRASRQQVKDFATMMIRDHTQTTQQLTALLPTLNIAAPTPQLDATMQGRLDSLRGQSGEAFDDAYLDAQVNAHEQAVRTFETYIAGSQTTQLREWANTTLPKLREHLAAVQGLENAT